MTDEQRQRAMEMLTGQAKEAVIVTVLERIADGVYEVRNEARQLRKAVDLLRTSRTGQQ